MLIKIIYIKRRKYDKKKLVYFKVYKNVILFLIKKQKQVNFKPVDILIILFFYCFFMFRVTILYFI